MQQQRSESVPARRNPRRRDALVDAAVATFATKGVASTSVDDIVRAAGVAKGTFYLYFDTRDDIVSAVAERLVDGVGRAMDDALGAADRSAAERIRGIAGAMAAVGTDPYERELLEALHRPGNEAVHDRLSGRIVDRLAPAVTGVIADGVAAGEFVAQDPRQSAAFVLACFSSLHDLVDDAADMPAVVDSLNTFILRGLGHRTEASR
jgi:AcrR family transcriptional regulator